MRQRWFLSLVASLLASCGSHADRSVTAAAPTDAARLAWIAKTARTLHGGEPLAPADVRALAALPDDQVVDRLMADKNFGDSVLGFNLYYLGYEPARLYSTTVANGGSRVYDYSVFAKPQAIAAAQSIMQGGGLEALYDLKQPLYVSPLFPPDLPSDNPHAKDPNLTDDAKRQALRDASMAEFDKLLVLFKPDAHGKVDKTAACNAIKADSSIISTIQNGISFAGLGYTGVDLQIYPQIEGNLDCNDPTVTGEALLQSLTAYRDQYKALFAEMDGFEADRYPVHSVSDLRAFKSQAGSQFSFIGFWNALPNSSTNRDRKRAAYMLKTYFCDDLTPIDVVAPSSPAPGHGANQHATDPGCQACHYKLDPMAGFFRNNGAAGLDFSKRPFFVFDDNSVYTGQQVTDYMAGWTDIGYIRSTRDRTKNDYGQTLADLFGIIQKAPEARQCLVRRMAEYYLGRDQVFDGGWLDHLTTELAAAPSSGQGFRTVVKDLVESQTFKQRDPSPDQCYDRYPPGRADSGLPCAVSWVIKKNCASCHNSTDQDVNGLDLTQWIQVGKDAAGKPVMSFAHLDDAGHQLDQKTTMQRILARLGSTDPDEAMPKNKDMNAVDKARLYKWVSAELGQ